MFTSHRAAQCRSAASTTERRRSPPTRPRKVTPVRHLTQPNPTHPTAVRSRPRPDEEQAGATGGGPGGHVGLRGVSAAAQRPADGRRRLLQLAHQTLPRGLPEDLRRQRVSSINPDCFGFFWWFVTGSSKKRRSGDPSALLCSGWEALIQGRGSAVNTVLLWLSQCGLIGTDVADRRLTTTGKHDRVDLIFC